MSSSKTGLWIIIGQFKYLTGVGSPINFPREHLSALVGQSPRAQVLHSPKQRRQTEFRRQNGQLPYARACDSPKQQSQTRFPVHNGQSPCHQPQNYPAPAGTLKNKWRIAEGKLQTTEKPQLLERHKNYIENLQQPGATAINCAVWRGANEVSSVCRLVRTLKVYVSSRYTKITLSDTRHTSFYAAAPGCRRL